MGADVSIRTATDADVPALEALIRRSVHGLQAEHYDNAQREAALGSVFGVDHRLISDGTYFVAERAGALAGCGGWSFRAAMYGAHGPAESDGPRVNPGAGPARVRAFFVDPEHARRGVGAALLAASEAAAAGQGFTRAALSATLAGEPFYAAHGYTALARGVAELPGGGELPIVHMEKRLG